MAYRTALLIPLLLLGIAYSQSTNQSYYGTSQILLNQSTLVFTPGNTTMNLTYTVLQATGNYSLSTINVTNAAQLGRYGISTNISDPQDFPTFSGTLTVEVSQNTGSGNYQGILQVFGGNPSLADAVFNVTVYNATTLAELQSTGKTGPFKYYNVTTTIPYNLTSTISYNVTTIQGTTTVSQNGTVNGVLSTATTTVPATTNGTKASPVLIVIAAAFIVAGCAALIYLFRKR